MPNIGYFEVPADDVERAKGFYRSLLGWMIEPTQGLDPAAVAAMQYYNTITTGEPREGTLNTGGCKTADDEGVVIHVMVDDIDALLANVERLGGKIIMSKMVIPSVGLDAIVQDTEGNAIGLWQPARE